MWTILIALAAVAGLLGLCAVLALLWLGRTLQWSTLEDDQIDFSTPTGRGRFRWFTSWMKPRDDLLTYRRDHLGRFRKHRR